MNATIMADVKRTLDENGRERLIVNSDKTKVPYYITKTNDGYIFYEVKTGSGPVPKELEGYFRGPDKALEAVLKYLTKIRPSAAVRRDEYQKERSKRNGSKSSTND